MSGIDIAIALLELAFKAAPELVAIFRALTSGNSDPLVQRIVDIMPEESASRKAQHDLGG